MTNWQDQRDDMLAEVSKQHGAPAKREFIAFRAKQLALCAGELKTKRHVMDAMRRKYERLRATYLRVEGTTYGGWLKHGPQVDWEEVIAAACDDAVWDRLVDRCVDKERTRG